ncbi:MAG: hypothetical protein IKU48_06135 [Clostridia bacterium]|nr:hypothetical protein [Clostridia bacterium]
MNKNRQNKKSPAKNIAFSAILCALGVIIMFLGAVIETIDITMAALASFLVIVCIIEVGGYMPFLVFATTSTLSMLLLPNKTVAVIYAMYFGFYPILKKYLERLPIIISWIAKFVVFNMAITIYYIFLKDVLFPDINSIKLYLVLLLNVIFFTLDLAQTLFITAYVRKFRNLLGIHRFFK